MIRQRRLQPELEVETKEGYSADIYTWRYMSEQCLHYVRTTSHEGYMSPSRGRCCADIVRTYIPGENCFFPDKKNVVVF